MQLKKRITVFDRNWKLLAEVLESEELGKRLLKFWGLVASLGGMIAGFTYVVSNSTVQIPATSTLNGVKRQDIFGILVAFAFLSALSSTIVSAILWGNLNMIGKENSNWFLERYPSYFVRLPLNLLIFSLFAMLGSLLTTIDALYSRKVFWTVLVAGVFTIISVYTLYIYSYIKISAKVQLIHSQLKDNKEQKEKKEVTELVPVHAEPGEKTEVIEEKRE